VTWAVAKRVKKNKNGGESLNQGKHLLGQGRNVPSNQGDRAFGEGRERGRKKIPAVKRPRSRRVRGESRFQDGAPIRGGHQPFVSKRQWKQKVRAKRGKQTFRSERLRWVKQGASSARRNRKLGPLEGAPAVLLQETPGGAGRGVQKRK